MPSRRVIGPLVLAASLLLAGCASDGRTRSAVGARGARTVDREAVRRETEQRALAAERVELRRAEALTALQRLGGEDDHAALRRVYDVDATVLTERHPAELAEIAPRALRVYGLSTVLADGPDDPVRLPADVTEAAPLDGYGHLLARVVDQIRADGDALFEGEHAVLDVCGPCVFAVLPDDAAFARLEQLLDRHATIGGGYVRIEVVVGKGAGDVPQAIGPAWRTGDFDAIASRLAARGTVERLVLDVPFGRERGALRGRQTSYLKDYDVDAASGFADPLIDVLPDGLMLSAVYRPAVGDGGTGEPELAIRVAVSEIARPVPEFTTLFSPDHEPVRLQIPEVRMSAFSATTTPDARRVMSARVFGDRALYLRAVPHAGRPVSPAWSRVIKMQTRARPYDHPLLTNALALAAAGADEAREAVREAASLAETPIWGQRVRPSAEQQQGVLFRWPTGGDDDAARRALAGAGVSPAAGYGFVDVASRHVLACVAPESVQPLARALMRLGEERGESLDFELACPVPVSAGDTPQAGSSCADVTQISFIQDFDVEIAEDTAIADPIIGVLQDGAVVDARPVPSAGPGVYDVHIAHAVLDGPMPVFMTGLGMGPEVSIQLPRLSHHTTWVRVEAGPGDEVPIVSKLVARAAEDDGARHDVRRFVLRRLR